MSDRTRRLPRRARGLMAVGLMAALCMAAGAGPARTAAAAPLVGLGSSSPPPRPAPGAGVPSAGRAGQAASTFKIAGNVAGLYPGASKSLTLTVTNPFTYSITVGSITTTVSNASSLCPASNLHVASFSGALVVAAGHVRRVVVSVGMRHAAPNACQGAGFPLHYRGVGTRT